MNANNKSNVSWPVHKGWRALRGLVPGSRVFRWIKGLWKKPPVEPSFRLVRMKKVPTVMLMYFEPGKETTAPHIDLSESPVKGLHDSDEGSREYCSVYCPPTIRPPTYEVGSNLPQTAGCYIAYRPGAGSILQPAVSNALKDSKVEGNRSSTNVKSGNTVSGYAHEGLGSGLVNQKFANRGFASDNPSGMALHRDTTLNLNTAPEQAALPAVKQRIEATYRESPDAMTVKYQDGSPCSRPLAAAKRMPTASDEEQKPDERDMLPSRQRHQVTAGLPEIATPPEPKVIRPTPPPAPPTPRLRRRPGYRLLRRAAVGMDEGVAWCTPLLCHPKRPSAAVPQTIFGLYDLPSQLLTEPCSY